MGESSTDKEWTYIEWEEAQWGQVGAAPAQERENEEFNMEQYLTGPQQGQWQGY